MKKFLSFFLLLVLVSSLLSVSVYANDSFSSDEKPNSVSSRITLVEGSHNAFFDLNMFKSNNYNIVTNQAAGTNLILPNNTFRLVTIEGYLNVISFIPSIISSIDDVYSLRIEIELATNTSPLFVEAVLNIDGVEYFLPNKLVSQKKETNGATVITNVIPLSFQGFAMLDDMMSADSVLLTIIHEDGYFEIVLNDEIKETVIKMYTDYILASHLWKEGLELIDREFPIAVK